MSTKLPIKAKASTQAKIKVVLFGIIGLFLAFAAVYLWMIDVTVGGSDTQPGEPMPVSAKLIITVVAAVVAVGCFRMLWILIPMIAGKRPSATVTERGIEDTYIMINLFAFSTLFHVKIIPWSALVLTPHPAGQQTESTSCEVYFRIKTSAITDECGSKTVQRVLKNIDGSTLSIAFHMSLTPEEASLVRSLMSK